MRIMYRYTRLADRFHRFHARLCKYIVIFVIIPNYANIFRDSPILLQVGFGFRRRAYSSHKVIITLLVAQQPKESTKLSDDSKMGKTSKGLYYDVYIRVQGPFFHICTTFIPRGLSPLYLILCGKVAITCQALCIDGFFRGSFIS